jgi:hypothetical protein
MVVPTHVIEAADLQHSPAPRAKQATGGGHVDGQALQESGMVDRGMEAGRVSLQVK